jgi:HSP20 family protein
MVMRYDPFADVIPIRQMLNRLFDMSVVHPSSLLGTITGAQLPYDLYETDHELVFTGALPGIDQQSLEIAVNQGVLTIKGERTAPGADQQTWVWYNRGLAGGSVQLAVTLPAPVNADQAQAHYEHGLLTVRLPKAEEVKPRKITLSSAVQREALPAGAR